MTTISYAAAISTALSAETKKVEIYGHLPPRQNRAAAAAVTIHEAGEMTKRGRAEVAQWLRHQAEALETDGADYADLFRARYLCTPERRKSARGDKLKEKH